MNPNLTFLLSEYEGISVHEDIDLSDEITTLLNRLLGAKADNEFSSLFKRWLR